MLRIPLPPKWHGEKSSSRGNCHERSFYYVKTKQLVINAMLAAMCAALGALALDMTSIKVTFESLPILLGALLFGPVSGAAIGGWAR
jgi:uncharacterized membrane protein